LRLDRTVGEMGGDPIAGREFRNRTDGLTVLGHEAVAHAVYAFGVTGCEALFEQLNPMFSNEYLPFCGACEPRHEVSYPFGLSVQTVYQPFSDRRRRLERVVRHKIED
jgi:hypothetical protein